MQWTCNDIGHTCVIKMPELRTDLVQVTSIQAQVNEPSEIHISDEEFAVFLRSI